MEQLNMKNKKKLIKGHELKNVFENKLLYYNFKHFFTEIITINIKKIHQDKINNLKKDICEYMYFYEYTWFYSICSSLNVKQIKVVVKRAE